MQNFPKRRHREIRKQIIPPPGYVFAMFDYGQLEARVIAMASRCATLCKHTIDKIDIHSKWLQRSLDYYPPYIDRLAQKSNTDDLAQIMKGGRDTIKTDFVFASFFGSEADACAKRTGIPLNIVRPLLGEFWTEYDGVAKWLKRQRQEYADTGSIRTLTGMERHGLLWGNEPINTPIQGTAAHLVLDAQNAMLAHARRLKEPSLVPRINIHDDLIFILPDIEEEIAEYIKFIGEELVAVRYDWQIVPLSVECRLAYNWAEETKREVFIGDYVR